MLVLKSKTASKSENEGGKGSGDVVLSGSMTRQVCPLVHLVEEESMLICRPRSIIHLQILLGISLISDEWSRIWSESFHTQWEEQ